MQYIRQATDFSTSLPALDYYFFPPRFTTYLSSAVCNYCQKNKIKIRLFLRQSNNWHSCSCLTRKQRQKSCIMYDHCQFFCFCLYNVHNLFFLTIFFIFFLPLGRGGGTADWPGKGWHHHGETGQGRVFLGGWLGQAVGENLGGRGIHGGRWGGGT
jgi:hypothetical protein